MSAIIIITGVLPGIVTLGVYALVTGNSPLFWKSDGEQFKDLCLSEQPDSIKP